MCRALSFSSIPAPDPIPYRGVSLILLFFFMIQSVSAQRFGGNPPTLHWSQIHTDTVRVIYPDGLDSLAQRVANVAHYMNRQTGHTIGSKVRKINIVLQNQTTVSNGYVGLAPWRSEFYITPMQNSLSLGSVPWIDQLAVHEYRHVQQYMNFQEGPAKVAWFILGEQGQALLNSMTVPEWFFEGDAVFQETAVTEQGRGRLPDFYNGYRSLWQEGKKYSYQKLRNGSYKHYVPNHYPLGYMLVAHGRETYGPEFWRQVTQDAVRLKPFFYPMQGAIQKYSGRRFNDFVQDAFNTFRDDSLLRADAGPVKITSMHKRSVSDYLYPVLIGRDSILALKDSYRKVPGWVIVHDGKETRLRTRDIAVDPYHSYRNGKLLYTAWKPQLRWAWQDFSDIRIMDVRTGQSRQVTKGSRYFSPDLSPDEREIAAVYVRKDGASRIHLVDAHSGSLLREMENPNGYFHTYPVYSKGGDEIFTAVRNRLGQMALVAIRKDDGTERVLVPFSDRPIAFLRVRGDYVVFSAAYDREDGLWAWNDAAGELINVGSNYTGSYMPELDTARKEVIYAGFTSGGLMLSQRQFQTGTKMDLSRWASASAAMYAEKALDQENSSRIYERIGSAPNGIGQPGVSPGPRIPRPEKQYSENSWAWSAVPNRKFPSSHYKSSTRLFNFHSWRPWYEQPDWSVAAFSENVLNTFRSEIYYNYNQNEGYHKMGFNALFGGWYPWITGGASYTVDRFVADGPSGSNLTRSFNWNELNVQAGFRLPFDLSGGRHFRFLSLAGTYNNQQLYFKETSSGKPEDQAYRYLQWNMQWSMQSQQARQHIFPRFAHVLSLQFRNGIGELEAKQFLGSASLYLPGFHPNHNLVFGASYQARDTLGQYFFTNNFALSRGYPGLDYPRMARLSANYHFPLFYPDFGFGNVIYFLRVRANTWFDATGLKSLRSGTTTLLRSTGVEIYFDTRFWNEQAISFGVRYSRLLDADEFANPLGKNQWEIILPLNLIPN
jgi:hypothetical protein